MSFSMFLFSLFEAFFFSRPRKGKKRKQNPPCIKMKK